MKQQLWYWSGIGRTKAGIAEEWLESCIGGLEGSVGGFTGLDDTAKAKLCFEQFLYSDMNFCGAGMLPRDVHKLHLVDLKGPFVLQRVFGMEYRPIKDLDVLAPSGLKAWNSDVGPQVVKFCQVGWWKVREARQRLVNEVNKPPRGKGVTAQRILILPQDKVCIFRIGGCLYLDKSFRNVWRCPHPHEIHPITPGLPSAVNTAPVYRRDARSNFPTVSVPFNTNVTGPTFSSDAASHGEDIHMADLTTEEH
ncbi:hypothetical protein HAX54_034393 [Datura stramonium]|uniref:RMI1 N-terminal domain-containing protein n=1 Tax=Datura stramonium TaxID=4076 RepID=A0ABS8SEJ7_DATST|nr:hypothetical protein [Datura stramonium]